MLSSTRQDAFSRYETGVAIVHDTRIRTHDLMHKKGTRAGCGQIGPTGVLTTLFDLRTAEVENHDIIKITMT